MMPASRSGWRKPVCSEIAPPWEKPARTILDAADPTLAFAGDQRLDQALGRAHPALVLAPGEVVGDDVVPRAHRHPVVDRHRLHRRVRKDEPDRRGRKVELADDRHEVAAVGTEAVQPDDAPLRIAAGFELDRVEKLGHQRFGRCADLGRNALTTASWVSMYGPPMRSMQ